MEVRSQNAAGNQGVESEVLENQLVVDVQVDPIKQFSGIDTSFEKILAIADTGKPSSDWQKHQKNKPKILADIDGDRDPAESGLKTLSAPTAPKAEIVQSYWFVPRIVQFVSNFMSTFAKSQDPQFEVGSPATKADESPQAANTAALNGPHDADQGDEVGGPNTHQDIIPEVLIMNNLRVHTASQRVRAIVDLAGEPDAKQGRGPPSLRFSADLSRRMKSGDRIIKIFKLERTSTKLLHFEVKTLLEEKQISVRLEPDYSKEAEDFWVQHLSPDNEEIFSFELN